MTADVAVVGLGPAGRALAHRLLHHGARVVAVDPHPDRPWRPTYGGWTHQLPNWLPETVVGARAERTELVAHASHRIEGTYAVLANDRLRDALSLAGADVQERAVPDGDLPGLAPVVIDCRGNTRALASRCTPVQEAHGLALSGPVGRELLGGADAVLMDWRPFDCAVSWGRRAASFCYVVPLPDGRVLAEETCLAGRPPVPQRELAGRLTERLRRHGLADADLNHADVERVHIAMLPPAPAPGPVLSFGAAGRQLNPITGYSVFASLHAADTTAAAIASGGRPLTSRLAAHSVRRTALQALLHLDADETRDLFDAFGRLPAARQRAVFAPDTPPGALLAALGHQAALLPLRRQLGLVDATARGLVR